MTRPDDERTIQTGAIRRMKRHQMQIKTFHIRKRYAEFGRKMLHRDFGLHFRPRDHSVEPVLRVDRALVVFFSVEVNGQIRNDR